MTLATLGSLFFALGKILPDSEIILAGFCGLNKNLV